MDASPRLSPRTLSIGGATYDLFLSMNPHVERSTCDDRKITFELGKKIPIERVVESCGGGAVNTSVGLSRLGCTAAFCGVMGDDQWGEKLLANLKKEHVDSSSATIVEGETSSFSIVLVLSSGERTILYNAGVNEHLHDTTFDREAMRGADVIYLNHLCEQSCMIEDDVIAILATLPNAHLTWNPGGCQIDSGMHAKDTAALLKRTNFLILNKEEAQRFTGTTDMKDAMHALLAAGVRIVCITDGGRGTYASDSTQTWFCPPRKNIKIIDTTGAGDAFGTAATWALVMGMDLPTALIAGTLNASSVLGKMGAQPGLLTDTQIHSLLKQSLIKPTIVHW